MHWVGPLSDAILVRYELPPLFSAMRLVFCRSLLIMFHEFVFSPPGYLLCTLEPPGTTLAVVCTGDPFVSDVQASEVFSVSV